MPIYSLLRLRFEIVKPCDNQCLTCYGPAANNCFTCDKYQNLILDINSCVSTCPPGK